MKPFQKGCSRLLDSVTILYSSLSKFSKRLKDFPNLIVSISRIFFRKKLQTHIKMFTQKKTTYPWKWPWNHCSVLKKALG